ncbi:transcription termination/antitermination NusG family protein [uncultured Brevundimonas sp.]|uniref:transcription termination/antitermination protein NusG n=1 Tax=uncultured Brevundimonas sp. TaxID=213418 RepID=UPI002627B9F8|nr:transcription termination/antitermination NusG family protein [uncultured Brevundimonas sp.]
MTDQRWNLKAKLDPQERQAWFVVRTNARCERKALNGLQERGFTTYMPVEAKWRRNGRERKRVEGPLMVGYLFAALEPGQSIYDLRRTDGVHSVVGVNGTPIQVSPWDILRFAAAEDEGAYDRTGAKRPEFKPGEMVKITAGHFKGYDAKVDSMLPDGKVRIILDTKFIRGELTYDDDQLRAA